VVRANAAEALGKMGEAAAAALPALEAAARDDDGGVRAQALLALGEVAPRDGGSDAVLLAALRDAEPRVRAAAAETLGRVGAAGDAANAMLALLDDANDQVKFHAIRALPRLAGPTAAVVEGLSQRLLADDSPWIRETAAQAIGALGPAAAGAGASLLRAARTGEVAVREESLRSLAMVQPPEAAAAFAEGMRDAAPEVRKVASAGWMRAAEIPEAAVPVLVEALHDPEVQVRANAAHALSRLESLPDEAVPLLTECAADPNDGLRLNAVVALRGGAPAAAGDVLHRLIEDPNSRIRLIAAGAVLAREPADAPAAGVVSAALSDPALRLRKVAVDVIASLGGDGVVFLETLRQRAKEEDDPGLRDGVEKLVSVLEATQAPATEVPPGESDPDPSRPRV
jgi:HEAT repeat protein